jgi:hypothetical protein
VNDAERVRGPERGGDLLPDVQRARERDGSRRDLVAEIAPLDVLEHEKDGPIRELAEIRRGDHVLVADVRRGPCLALEPCDELRDRRELAVKHLDRHALVHQHVFADVHAAHSAAVDQ